jgi:hypothetical protein
VRRRSLPEPLAELGNLYYGHVDGLQAPLAQHVPLQVVPRQLHPSSGFPEQLTQSGEQWLTHTPLSHVGEEKQVEQRVPHPPQCWVSVLVSTHAPPQFVVPLGHWQMPLEQVLPVGHVWPQVPQLRGSVCRLTQAPLQVSGAVPGHMHVPPEHVALVSHV